MLTNTFDNKKTLLICLQESCRSAFSSDRVHNFFPKKNILIKNKYNFQTAHYNLTSCLIPQCQECISDMYAKKAGRDEGREVVHSAIGA